MLHESYLFMKLSCIFLEVCFFISYSTLFIFNIKILECTRESSSKVAKEKKLVWGGDGEIKYKIKAQ